MRRLWTAGPSSRLHRGIREAGVKFRWGERVHVRCGEGNQGPELGQGEVGGGGGVESKGAAESHGLTSPVIRAGAGLATSGLGSLPTAR